jgi:hypothetical protein
LLLTLLSTSGQLDTNGCAAAAIAYDGQQLLLGLRFINKLSTRFRLFVHVVLLIPTAPESR